MRLKCTCKLRKGLGRFASLFASQLSFQLSTLSSLVWGHWRFPRRSHSDCCWRVRFGSILVEFKRPRDKRSVTSYFGNKYDVKQIWRQTNMAWEFRKTFGVKQIWRQNWTHFPTSTGDMFLTKGKLLRWQVIWINSFNLLSSDDILWRVVLDSGSSSLSWRITNSSSDSELYKRVSSHRGFWLLSSLYKHDKKTEIVKQI